MKREVKFRAWITTNKNNWTEEDYPNFDWSNRMRVVSHMAFPLDKSSGKDIGCEPICENDPFGFGWHSGKWNDGSTPEYILMQFAGFKDKNGKEIYEGDILSEMWKCEVYQDSNTGAFMVRFHTAPTFNKPQTLHYYLNSRLRAQAYGNDNSIIGNIYENPELIKV